MKQQSIRPGRWLYWLGGVMIVVGIALAVVGILGFVGGIAEMRDRLQRVVVPGTGTLTLDEPGTYTIYHEHQSAVGGRTYSNPPILSGLTCTVTSKESGGPASLSEVTMSKTYTLGSRAGIAVWQFDVEKAGEYQLSATYAPGATGPPVVLAVGRRLFGWIAKKILGLIAGLVALFLLGGGALAIILVTYLKRRSARKRLAQGQAGGV